MSSSSAPAEVVVAEEGDAAAAHSVKDAAFESGGTVRRPGRLRVMHPHVAELLRGPRRNARPAAAKPAAPQHPLGGGERARYACAFEDGDDVGDGGVAAPGRLVWAKVRDHPWWPGQVFDAADASAEARAHRRQRGAVLVAYFWDKSFGWNDAGALLPLRAGFPRLAAVAPVAAAVDAALAEVARRVAAGLSCYCGGGGESVARAHRQVIDNAGVRDGAYGAHVDAAFARGALHGEALVGYVAALATNPRAGADRVDLTVAAAQLEAFGRWRGSTRGLPKYDVVHGIDGGVVFPAAKRMRPSPSTAGDGSAKRRRRATTKGKNAADTGDYEALEQEDLPRQSTPPQQMPTKIGKLMSRAAQQMSQSPVILRTNGSAGLVLNFSSESAVPSRRHLTRIFSRFGVVKDVRAENSTALVIFKNGAHADDAFAGTAMIGSIKASLVSFRVTWSLPAAPVDPPLQQSTPSDASPDEALQ